MILIVTGSSGGARRTMAAVLRGDCETIAIPWRPTTPLGRCERAPAWAGDARRPSLCVRPCKQARLRASLRRKQETESDDKLQRKQESESDYGGGARDGFLCLHDDSDQ